MPGVRTEDAIGNRRRGRRRVVSDVWEWLPLEVRGKHLIHPINLWGSAILVVILVVVGAAIEV